MSDQDDSSKTEEPTQKKLDEALKKGDVAKSQELPTVLLLFGAAMIIMLASGSVCLGLAKSLQGIFANASDIPTDGGHLRILAMQIIKAVLAALAVPFSGFIVSGVIGHLVQHRFVFSAEAITPKFSKVSPLAGLKRLFSSQSLVNFVKGLAKIIIVGTAIFITLWPERNRFETLIGTDVAAILPLASMLILKMLTAVLVAMVLIAILDFMYQRSKWYNRQKMTVQELKEEYKQQEGNPEIKAKLKQIRRDKARRRMISEVPKAAVIITNPTHYAVALQYEKGMQAPICLAKGVDNVALKIREIATENNIPIVENVPLARALHAAIDLGDEVPTEHYKAVAEVIGYVMNMKNRKRWAAA